MAKRRRIKSFGMMSMDTGSEYTSSDLVGYAREMCRTSKERYKGYSLFIPSGPAYYASLRAHCKKKDGSEARHNMAI